MKNVFMVFFLTYGSVLAIVEDRPVAMYLYIHVTSEARYNYATSMIKN